ncbi:hypothetical protein AURDEDRAFT_183879 [Auricularia subglabra TFB-10046 SS5]|nr:hypothetical protein AURDEDRAFT_183879 [Auricularia subglabra TFB-10046 SS5]
MMLAAALGSLLIFARAVNAISWGIDLASTSGNVWMSMQYTLTVPAAPPSTVTKDPWLFGCGLQPGSAQGSPGAVAPVLQYRSSAPSYVNPNPSFGRTWAVAVWMVRIAGQIGSAGQTTESPAIWLGEGDKVISTITYAGGNWTQTAFVSSGRAAGLSIQQNEAASKVGFPTNAARDSNAQSFLCESLCSLPDLSQWAADVVFSDVYFTAKASNGVQSACQAAQKVKNDGLGVAIPSGFSMPNPSTCYFETVRLVPPGPCTSDT